MDYKIHVNDTPEKEDYLVVIIIDDKHKTEASFALSKTEKVKGQIRLIQSALAKVSFLNAQKEAKKKVRKSRKIIKKVVKK